MFLCLYYVTDKLLWRTFYFIIPVAVIERNLGSLQRTLQLVLCKEIGCAVCHIYALHGLGKGSCHLHCPPLSGVTNECSERLVVLVLLIVALCLFVGQPVPLGLYAFSHLPTKLYIIQRCHALHCIVDGCFVHLVQYLFQHCNKIGLLCILRNRVSFLDARLKLMVQRQLFSQSFIFQPISILTQLCTYLILIGIEWLHFAEHLATEQICFQTLSSI